MGGAPKRSALGGGSDGRNRVGAEPITSSGRSPSGPDGQDRLQDQLVQAEVGHCTKPYIDDVLGSRDLNHDNNPHVLCMVRSCLGLHGQAMKVNNPDRYPSIGDTETNVRAHRLRQDDCSYSPVFSFYVAHYLRDPTNDTCHSLKDTFVVRLLLYQDYNNWDKTRLCHSGMYRRFYRSGTHRLPAT